MSPLVAAVITRDRKESKATEFTTKHEEFVGHHTVDPGPLLVSAASGLQSIGVRMPLRTAPFPAGGLGSPSPSASLVENTLLSPL